MSRFKDNGDVTDYEFEEVAVESKKAYCLKFADGDEHWIPKSVAEVDLDARTVTLPQWFIDKNELDLPIADEPRFPR